MAAGPTLTKRSKSASPGLSLTLRSNVLREAQLASRPGSSRDRTTAGSWGENTSDRWAWGMREWESKAEEGSWGTKWPDGTKPRVVRTVVLEQEL